LDLNAAGTQALIRSESPHTAVFRNPVGTERACSFLGLTLGTIPTTAIFSRFLIEKPLPGEAWPILLLLALSIAATGAAGYFTGKTVGKALKELERSAWPAMIIMLFLVGILWGLISGAAGGLFLFIFGAIPGAMIGAAAGACALPLFGVLHRLLEKDGLIERDHLLPVAFGISTLAAGLMVGFPGF